ncbi:MAG: hypothetical protein ACLPJH_00235 [Myxococcaceae bacterium]
MKTTIALATFLLIGCQQGPGAQQDLVAPATNLEPKSAAQAPARGFLLLEVTPWGKLFIDGKMRADVEGAKRISLSPGVHEVRLVNKKCVAWTVTIESGKTRTLTYSFD